MARSAAYVQTGPARAAIAAILAGSWRQVPPPLDLDSDTIHAALPRLQKTSAVALAWWRLRAAGLHTQRPMRAMQHVYRQQAAEAAVSEEYLQAAVSHLRSQGVEPILIKGWSVARLYPDTALRPYSDLDLCIHPDQFDRAIHILAKANMPGWRVELHRGIPDLRNRTWEASFRRSQRAKLGVVEVRILAAEDLLRLLCVHLLRHARCTPMCLCDLGAVLESRPRDFDWDYCLRGPTFWSDWILCLLALTGRLMGARLDEPRLMAWADRMPAWLIPTVLSNWARPLRRAVPLFDPLRSAYRRRLRPCHSRTTIQALGFLGRAVEIPSRLYRQCRRWHRPQGLPLTIHDEAGE